MNEKILSICIPTYNRANYLDISLSIICEQIKNILNNIELIVSDNCSTDNTIDIVLKYKELGFPILYYKQTVNTGLDGNITNCFIKASCKYVWIFGDDDILIEGGINKIMNLIKADIGVIYLNSYVFSENYKNEKPTTVFPIEYNTFLNPSEFLNKISYQCTFVSAFICNKSLIDSRNDIQRYMGTNINLLSWIIPLMFKGKPNIYYYEYLLASKGGNSGGYMLFEVFATNMNKVLNGLIDIGLEKRTINKINNDLIIKFFPFFINNFRFNSKKNTFLDHQFFWPLYSTFKRYFAFYLVIVPISFSPKFIVRVWTKIIIIPLKAIYINYSTK